MDNVEVLSIPSVSRRDTENSNKNIYDLSEFEVPVTKPISNIPVLNNIDASENVLKTLSQKYSVPSCDSASVKCDQNVILLTDSSDDDDSVEKDPNKCYSNQGNELEYNNTLLEKWNSYEKLHSNSSEEKSLTSFKRNLERVSSSSSDNEENSIKKNRLLNIPDIDNANNRIKGKKINVDISKKLQTEKRKLERAQKKEQVEREKSLKQAQRLIDKSNKPDECLKYIIVNMDDTVFNNKTYGEFIKQELKCKDITYRLKTSLPGIISWSRRVLSMENMVCKETEIQEKCFAAIATPKVFDDLLGCIEGIKKQTHFTHLSIFIFGQSKPTSAQEDDILNVELMYHTYWQFVKTKEELSNFLFMITKSVAQIPYKLQQEEKLKNQNEYFQDCNKNLVKVDKSGNGLGRLWRQMLTMFPLVRLEAAEAIAAVYPSPAILSEAYRNCTERPEELLQDLPIRRAHGPLVSMKRLGPELSKKCYNFFTSEENVFI